MNEALDQAYLEYSKSETAEPLSKDTFIIYAVFLGFSYLNHYLVSSTRLGISLLIWKALDDCKDALQRELTTQECFDIYELMKDLIEYHKS